ncbi:MAG TPA: hypothetical protein PLA05_02405 [bacterium]|jgi:hypothetical protein|nr:MAG: hypothetical protein BWX82_00708 [Parcubacteria group bacterium ADurb.Bin115]HNU81514.1 hypothetical protein [bacterium]HOD87147.1 hypothetical protein [bacterium]HPW05795.1 hypothetical protein [bacterium]HQB76482.1 hypothetical protein [bacterium]
MSNTLDIDFCPRALERTYEITIPDIMNSDQGQSLNDKTPTEVYFGQNKKTVFFQQFTNLHINSNIVPTKSTFSWF